MSFCRRLIHILVARHRYRSHNIRTLCTTALDPPASSFKLPEDTQHAPTFAFVSHEHKSASPTAESLLRRILDAPAQQAEDTMEEEEETTNVGGMIMWEAYEALRNLNRPSLVALPLNAWSALADQAITAENAEGLSDLLNDALCVIPRDDAAFLGLARFVSGHSHLVTLPAQSIMPLLHFVNPDDENNISLSYDVAKKLGRHLMNSPPGTFDLHRSTVLTHILVDNLSRLQSTSDMMSSRGPRGLVRLSFRCVAKMAAANQDVPALELFQQLISLKYIPQAALRPLDSPIDHSGILMGVALIRACLHWRWGEPSVDILGTVLDMGDIAHQRHLRPVTERLAIHTLQALLEVPEPRSLISFRRLFCRLHEKGRMPLLPVPNGLLHKFYSEAQRLRMGWQAQRVYETTRTPQIHRQHEYAAPVNRAAVGLLRHFVAVSGNLHLARTLVSEVVDGKVPLGPPLRAEFLVMVARCGFALSARTLWDRYSVGPDGAMIVGHSGLMLRMTSLFHRLSQKAEVGPVEAGNSSEDKATKPPHSMVDDTAAADQEQVGDYAAVVRRVMAGYVEIHRPIFRAGHQTLTSLARANFIVGDFGKGARVFKTLLKRKEIPDRHDIHVALSAVAEFEPRSAAKMIHMMIKRGWLPDAVTFGTILCQAIVQGDDRLVARMIYYARKHHVTLNAYTMDTLFRRTLSAKDDPLPVQQAKLRQVLAVVENMHEAETCLSPNLGVYCVEAALSAECPVIAFQFWKLLVNGRMEWTDAEQAILRKRIEESLRQLHPESSVENMLAELWGRASSLGRTD